MNDDTSPFAGLRLAVDEARRMEILHPRTNKALKGPDGEGWVEIYSSDSEIAKQHNRDLLRRRQAIAQRGGRAQMTPEEQDAEATDLLVALTAGWSLVDLDGNPIEMAFSRAAARELYDDPATFWLRQQVDQWAADRSNFMPAKLLH